mgnify:CR=1 FL=1
MRVLRGIGAALVLGVLVAGVPVILVSVGQLGRLSSIDWSHVLVQRDDGSLLLGVLTLLAWASWAVVTASVVLETAEAVRRVRLPHVSVPTLQVPGLDLPRLLVRGLVVAVVTLVLGLGQQGRATEAAVPQTLSAVQGVDRASTDPTESAAARPAAEREERDATPESHMTHETPTQSLHVVAPDDDLWSLAHSTYGDGTQWRRIVQANADLLQGPAELVPGTRLVLPGVTRDDGGSVVVVRKGDTLWHLAKTHLGDGNRWPEIYAANRELIDDPDEIEIGWRLVIPPRTVAPSTPLTPAAPTTAPPTTPGVGKGTTTTPVVNPTTTAPGKPTAPAAPSTPDSTGSRVTNPSASGQPMPTRTIPVATPTAPGTTIVPVTTATASRAPQTVPSATAAGRVTAAGANESSRVPSAPATTVAPTAPGTTVPTGAAASTTGAGAPTPASTTSGTPNPTAAPTWTTQSGASTPAPSRSLPSSPTTTAPAAPGTLPSVAGSRGSSSAPAPSTSAPVAPATSALVSPPAPSDDTPGPSRESLAAALLGVLGTGTAAAVIRSLHRRRELQLAVRPLGRRIPHPAAPAQRFEQALSLVAVEDLPGTSLPGHTGDEARGDDTHRAMRGVVTIGYEGPTPRTVDLEECRVLNVDLDDPEATWGCVAAMALELAVADDLDGSGTGRQVVAVGALGEVLAPAGLETVIELPTVAEALADMRRNVENQRAELKEQERSLAQARDDDSSRDAWWSRTYLFPPLTDAEAHTLSDLLGGGQQTAISAIVVGGEPEAFTAASPARAADQAAERPFMPPPRPRRALPQLGTQITGTSREAHVDPDGATVTPVGLEFPAIRAVTTLLGTTGRTDTEPAPWFAGPLIPDNVHVLHPRTASGSLKEVATMGTDQPGVTDFAHPTLLLLGPIGLIGAGGEPPARAERSCIEYCAWMLENPGATAAQMASALLVAEGTRRSNVSRLRGWLGTGADGAPYLPDAYTGRLRLDPCVSSDWLRLRMLIGPGVAKTSTDSLVAALRLVRGAPLADAAPGQWRWAEELRTDMASTVRDIGAVLAERAVASGDITLARWAASRALLAAPDDELLLRWRVKMEHVAGNRTEVERLAFRLTRHARSIGVDLDDETVTVIQEAIEGRSRARA